jgi:8-oxo-dGTP pyrophosphatase MutT (NUDIX family)
MVEHCTMAGSSRDVLLAELRAYAPSDERERAMRDRVVSLIEDHPDAFARSLLTGHVTASAWIVDPSRTRVLLLHHRKLDRWLQPGGHADGDVDLRRAALREAREETGLTRIGFACEGIYDIDVHDIPARPGEPEHEHFDVRFALDADPAEPLVQNRESRELAWVPLDELGCYGVDESVLRLARKTRLLVRR